MALVEELDLTKIRESLSEKLKKLDQEVRGDYKVPEKAEKNPTSSAIGGGRY